VCVSSLHQLSFRRPRRIRSHNALSPLPAEGGAISGATAFDLWETSGFPLDLTQLMAEEDGLAVDVPGYGAAMEAAREKSRAGARCAWCSTDRLCGLWNWSKPRASIALPGLGQHTTVRGQELHGFCSLCTRSAL